MKTTKLLSIVACSLLATSSLAQNWLAGGNPAGGPNGVNGANNILGTNGNFPIRIRTNGIQRMHINPNGTNYFGLNTSGFIGINTSNPRSMLHLNGPNNTTFGGAGWRDWMQTGLFSLENSDNLYVGMKDEGFNRSDAIICFGDDNAGAPTNNLRFMFSDISPNGNDPVLELGRFTAEGNFGVGPVFTNPQQPQSLVHLNRNGNQNTFMQITNQNGTGQTAQDGMRIGVVHQANPNNQFGAIGYQENRPLRFFTDWNNAPGGTINGERLRITTVNAPGVPNPTPQLTANTTRVSISHDGANPVTQPRSLLHLGYNTGSIGNPASTDGWREWMDVGTFTAVNSDNMYVGMKQRPNGGGIIDGYDAIINWGDNQGNVPAGPDVLRFVFTSTTGGGAQTPASSVDGLEVMQLDPDVASTLAAPNFGMVGIGDFSIGGGNAPIDAKLDIDGDLRIREVTQDNSLTQFLVIDPTDLNRVHYADLTQLDDQQIQDLDFDCNTNELTLTLEDGGTAIADFSCLATPAITADNGLIINPAANVQWGQVPNAGVPNGGELIRDTEIPMEGYNISFTGLGIAGQNLYSIGQPALTTGLNRSKFHVFNDHESVAVDGYTDGTALPANTLAAGTAGYIINANTEFAYGVYGLAEFGNFGSGFGVFGEAENNDQNYGVGGSANDNNSQFNWGGNFTASGAQVSARGVEATASSSTAEVFGVKSFAFAGSGNTNDVWGGYFDVANNGSGDTYAGYFDGDVVITGTILPGPSDANMKTNVNNITSSLDMIEQLNPVTFEYDNSNYPSMNLASGLQYGLIAQDVEPIIPEIVSEHTHPATYDSLGNVVTPEADFKAVEYIQLIPILISGAKEQKAYSDSLASYADSLKTVIGTQDSILTAMNDRLSQIEDCLNRTGLCDAGTRVNDHSQNIPTQEVTLEDVESIVLEQNVPNPFAEQTTIKYSLPESIQRAQLIFYNAEGKMIKTADITERGAGQLNVFASDLSTGIYTYALVADGKIIDTKRMVKSR